MMTTACLRCSEYQRSRLARASTNGSRFARKKPRRKHRTGSGPRGARRPSHIGRSGECALRDVWRDGRPIGSGVRLLIRHVPASRPKPNALNSADPVVRIAESRRNDVLLRGRPGHVLSIARWCARMGAMGCSAAAAGLFLEGVRREDARPLHAHLSEPRAHLEAGCLASKSAKTSSGKSRRLNVRMIWARRGSSRRGWVIRRSPSPSMSTATSSPPCRRTRRPRLARLSSDRALADPRRPLRARDRSTSGGPLSHPAGRLAGDLPRSCRSVAAGSSRLVVEPRLASLSVDTETWITISLHARLPKHRTNG